MKKLTATATLLFGLACDLGGFPSGVIARIGGDDVSYEEFEAYLNENLGEDAAGLESEVLSALLEQFLEGRLLERLALDRRLVSKDADQRQAIRALLEAEPIEAIDDQSIRAHYQEHRQQFTLPERVRLRQILVQERAVAERALVALEAGEPFEQVARRWSIEPNADRGGDQGELARADLPPAFAAAVFDLGAGELSGILVADYGFHIFQVVERLPAEMLVEAQVRSQIEEQLRTDRADARLAELLEAARHKYNLEIAERNLPFRFASSSPSPQLPTDQG